MGRRVSLLPLSPSRYGRAAVRLVRSRLRPAAAPVAAGHASGIGSFSSTKYADLYEEHALALTPDTSIGDGDFDTIGQVELAILVEAGLTRTSSLFDFGCGTGRLAVHAVPFLASGTYVGTDISPTMLRHAAALLTSRLGAIPARVRFETQPDERFPVSTPPDFFCAYSVFTHMEHEDIFRYLSSALTVSGPDTVFVASCLQLDLPEAQNIFQMSAAKPVDERWREVRNVVTSPDLFTEVTRLAGWTVTAWHPGSGPAGTMPDGTRVGLGQSIVVMRPTGP